MKPWPIFVISLADHSHRREPLLDQLALTELRYELFPAVDARLEVPKEYRNLICEAGTLYHFGRPMTNGEYGCALSHHLIYRLVCEKRLRGAVIFEDDARLAPGADQLLKLRFYERYDFVQFNYGFARVPRLGIGRHKITKGLVTERALANSGLASAYALSRKACEHMIKESIPLTKPADWPCDLRPLKPRLTVPKLADAPVEDPCQSSLMGARLAAKFSAFSRERIHQPITEVRRAKNQQSWLLRRFGWCYAKTFSGRSPRGMLGVLDRLKRST